MEVAEALEAEVVSIDSAMVYRDMDIGTDKPSLEERKRIPHHMIDVVEPTFELTVAHFQQMARCAVTGILESGKVPLLAGGSGLYFRAIVDPLEFPTTDPGIRRRLESFAARIGPGRLYEKLKELDPAAAERIEPGNQRRTIRALEVIEVTGRKFSSFRSAWDSWSSIYDLVVAGLTLPKGDMDERIDARVDRMIQSGWVEEVRRLDGLQSWSVTSAQALGYAQIREYLRGHLSLEEAIEITKRQTRRFARRQLRWFRADPRVLWFESDPGGASRYLQRASD